MRPITVQILTICLLAGVCSAAGKPKTSQRIGDLMLTLVGVGKPDEQETRPDHYALTVQLHADNVGKQALCASFSATLKASYGLEYHDFSFAPHALQIRELLPGESATAEYRFDVKTGSKPLELVLKPDRKSQACAGGKESSSAAWYGADQLTFDLANFEAILPQNRATPTGPPSERPGLRVFIAETKGGNHQAEAVKLFSEHCPLAQVTTAKETADYSIQLTPTSLRQSKNEVLLTNQKGDVIYSGATFSLGNAMKDACSRILSDANPK